jgi:CBS domain-containing protein
MITDVKTAEGNQSTQEVCKILYENKIGSIVIVKNSTSENKESKKTPVGIVTERDIVQLVSLPDNKLSVDQPVHLLMKTPVITINPNRSVIDAMETMQQKDIRRCKRSNTSRPTINIWQI